jgi:8-oxo-dGTP pyrophosphatase MutT (NUDIX family)
MNNFELPIKVEALIYCVKDEGVFFLAIKRSLNDGGFWQPLTGTLESSDTIESCIFREIKEEIGLDQGNIISISDCVHHFTWNKKKIGLINEYVFAVQIENDSLINLSTEHTEYKWGTKMEIKDLYFDIKSKKRKWRGRKDIRILTNIDIKINEEIIDEKGRILEVIKIKKAGDINELICEEKFYDNSSQYWKRRAFTYFNKQLARQMVKSGRREYFTKPRTYRGFINKIYPVIKPAIDLYNKYKPSNKDLPFKKDWYLDKNDYWC